MRLLPKTLILISVCRLTHKVLFHIKPVPDPFHHVQLMSQVQNFEKVIEQSKQQQKATAQRRSWSLYSRSDSCSHSGCCFPALLCLDICRYASHHPWNNRTRSPCRRAEPRIHPIPTMERIGAHRLGQTSLSPWVWNSDWSPAPHSSACLFHHCGFKLLQCFTPQKTGQSSSWLVSYRYQEAS